MNQNSGYNIKSDYLQVEYLTILLHTAKHIKRIFR